jgi:DNA-binding transcriptional ArsR family regulator
MYAILETLFSSTARVQILDLFLQNPGSQFYQREIERQTGQPIRAVQREVERLEGVGLLRRSAEGNRVFYTLDTSENEGSKGGKGSPSTRTIHHPATLSLDGNPAHRARNPGAPASPDGGGVGSGLLTW